MCVHTHTHTLIYIVYLPEKGNTPLYLLKKDKFYSGKEKRINELVENQLLNSCSLFLSHSESFSSAEQITNCWWSE